MVLTITPSPLWNLSPQGFLLKQGLSWHPSPTTFTSTLCVSDAMNTWHSLFPPFPPVVPTHLQSPASRLCCVHHLVFQGAPLPLLNLSFRTQTKGHFLLKIFPDLSLGWVGTPSSKHAHINVLLVLAILSVFLSPDYKYFMSLCFFFLFA